MPSPSGTPSKAPDGTYSYTFKGWSSERDDSYEKIFRAVFSKSELVPHSIYTSVDGSTGTLSVSPKAASAGTVITLTPKPFPGYSFKEYEVVSGDITIDNNSFIMPDSNVTIRVVFELVHSCQISFNPNGGNGTMSVKKVDSGTVYSCPRCAFTPPAGKEFSHWRIATAAYNVGESIMVTENITLTAIWKDRSDSSSESNSGSNSRSNQNSGSNQTVTYTVTFMADSNFVISTEIVP